MLIDYAYCEKYGVLDFRMDHGLKWGKVLSQVSGCAQEIAVVKDKSVVFNF